MSMEKHEEISILQQIVEAEPGCDRDGEWQEHGPPIMGWYPKLGDRFVRNETGRALFSSEKQAIEAAKEFQKRAIARLRLLQTEKAA